MADSGFSPSIQSAPKIERLYDSHLAATVERCVAGMDLGERMRLAADQLDQNMDRQALALVVTVYLELKERVHGG